MAIRRSTTASLFIAAALFAQAAPVSAQSADDQLRQGAAAYERNDFERAAELWEPLADKGEAEAMRNLAQLYRLGLGVTKNNRRAFELYRGAAEKGLAEAQVNTAFLYLTGEGTPKDPGEAALWFARAADQGNALAQFNLGLMYEKGVGLDQDRELARELYRLAAEQGQTRAIARLEALEPNGTTATNEDTARAAENQRRAPAKPEEPAAREEEPSPRIELSRRPDPKPAAPAAEKDAPLEEVAEERPARGIQSASARTAPPVPEPPQETEMPALEGKPVLIMRRAAESDAADEEPATASKGPARGAAPETARRPGMTPVPTAKAAPEPELSLRRSAEPVPKRQLAALTDPAQLAPVNDSRSLRGARIARIKRGEEAYAKGDFGTALELIGPLADEGMPIAQFWLGRMFNRGEGVRIDRFEAYSLWRSAAESGSGRSATALANLASRFEPQELQAAEAFHASRGR